MQLNQDVYAKRFNAIRELVN